MAKKNKRKYTMFGIVFNEKKDGCNKKQMRRELTELFGEEQTKVKFQRFHMT